MIARNPEGIVRQPCWREIWRHVGYFVGSSFDHAGFGILAAVEALRTRARLRSRSAIDDDD